MSTPEHENDTLKPRPIDVTRQVMQLLSLGNAPMPYDVGVVGTSEQEEQQMRKFDEAAEHTPSEIVQINETGSDVLMPDWLKLLATLQRTPTIYESKFVRDSYFRFDTTVTAGGTTATLQLPMIPQGKYAFLDEIHFAQTSGAGSSPNGYLTDQGIAQLFAVITPDGSTFGASYKSGRNVIPGGIVPLITMQSLVASATYLVGVQYQLMTKLDVPEFDLAAAFGMKTQDVKIRNDGFETGPKAASQTDSLTMFGGPYDFGGTLGDD